MKSGMEKDAFGVVDDAKTEYNIPPSLFVCETILDSYGTTGDQGKMVKTFNHLLYDLKLIPGKFTLDAMLKGLVRGGGRNMPEALYYFNLMTKKYLVSPNSHTYFNLFHCCLKSRNIHSACRIMTNICETRTVDEFELTDDVVVMFGRCVGLIVLQEYCVQYPVFLSGRHSLLIAHRQLNQVASQDFKKDLILKQQLSLPFVPTYTSRQWLQDVRRRDPDCDEYLQNF